MPEWVVLLAVITAITIISVIPVIWSYSWRNRKVHNITSAKKKKKRIRRRYGSQ